MFLLTVCATLSWSADRPQLAKSGSLRVDSPVAGYALFGASQIRALIGLPGLVRWTEPLQLNGAFEKLAIAPGEQYAVAVTGRDVVLIRLDVEGASQVARVKTDLVSIEGVVFSPFGSAFMLRSADGQAAVVTGAPAAPQLSKAWRLTGLPLAISDDGELCLVGDAEGGATLRTRESESGTRLDQVSAAAFSPRSRKLFVATASGSLAWLENGVVEPLLDAPQVGAIRQVMISDSGSAAYLASAERLWTLDLSSLEVKAELVEPKSASIHRTRVKNRILLFDEASGEVNLISGGTDSRQVDTLRAPAPQGN
jgi:hypothetical protein